MANLSPFCTCTNFKCPIHPTKHDKGCAPCIKKNLRLGEMPNCFFNLIEGAENRTGDSFMDFAALLVKPHSDVTASASMPAQAGDDAGSAGRGQ